MSLAEFVIVMVIGLAAGTLGGLAGIGGSLIMLPLLALVLGYEGDPEQSRHHAFMAAAMIVNVLVSLPAALRHHTAGVVRFDLARLLLPVMAMTIIAGVLVSNRFDGRVLKYLLAGFIAVYCVLNLGRAIRRTPEPDAHRERTTPAWLIAIGGSTGFVAGLLGIGGGIMMVPMLQIFTRLRIREAIGTSSAVMVLTAVVGSILKNATLGEHGRTLSESALLVAAMGPTAALGGAMGASLAHKLPTQTLRVVLSVLLLIAAGKLAEIPSHVRALRVGPDQHAPAPDADTPPGAQDGESPGPGGG